MYLFNFVKLINFSAFLSLIYYVSCTFNLEELKSTNYEIDISKTPVKIDEEQQHSILHVKSKYGQNYQCLLPAVEEIESTEKKDASGDENVDIKDLLKPLLSGPCLLKTKGWWTYEFCSGRNIKQYHIEDGKILGQVITLGLYQSDYDWNNETDENKFRHSKQRYHSQTYTNGSRCDLTGLPRSAEIRFYCEEDAGDYIYRVDEPGTCIYLLTVHTSRICSHPMLKPLPSNKAHMVSCSPLLDAEQYDQYLKKVEEEKSLAEIKRHKWLVNQQKRLKVLKSWAKEEPGIQLEHFEKLQSLDDSKIEAGTPIYATKLEANENRQDIEADGATLDYFLEQMLLKEYDRSIEKLKSLIPPDKFSAVKENMQKQISSIIKKAEEEGLNLDGVSKESSVTELVSMLNVFIQKLDKAEKDLSKTVDEEKTVMSAKMDKADGKFKPLDPDSSDSALFDDDKLHVRIRRLDRKSTDSNGELHEVDFAQRKQIEQAVKERLEKSGLDTGGRRIEVKIITAGYYDNEEGKDFRSLSDEETNQFQNMIMALLTGQQEALQEMERHKKLEENYKFIWHGNEAPKVDEEEE